jgi:hypothetical protein
LALQPIDSPNEFCQITASNRFLFARDFFMTTQFVTQFNKPLRSLCQSASLLTRLATFQCLSLAALRGLLAFSLFLPLTLATDYARAIPSEGHKMMIAAPSPYAVEVGKKVIAQGGNVVDVAVAVGLTLSVTSPYFAGLGGGGFALIKMKDDVDVIDFRETAPAKTSPNYYKDKAKDASITGGAAVGVPGGPGWPLGGAQKVRQASLEQIVC